jgi:hypothetical protein
MHFVQFLIVIRRDTSCRVLSSSAFILCSSPRHSRKLYEHLILEDFVIVVAIRHAQNQCVEILILNVERHWRHRPA